MGKRNRPKKTNVPTPPINPPPPELLRLILARLPVKTLVKFRCACKSWLSLIDSHDFTSLHLTLFPLNRTNTLMYSMEYIHSNGSNTITLGKPTTFRKLTQFAPQSLILSTSYGIYFFYHNHDYFFWNPSLRKTIQLPSCPFNSDPPPYDTDTFLLSFSFTTHDYKLVAFRIDDDDLPTGTNASMAFFSLRNFSWSSHIKRVFIPFQCVGSVSLALLSADQFVPLQGTSYWLRCWPSDSKIPMYLSWFDFDLEEFGFMDLPATLSHVIARLIFNLGDSLAIFTLFSSSISIWVLDKERRGGTWRLWFSGDSALGSCSLLKDCSFANSTRMFYDQESCTFLLVSMEKVLSYNIHTGEVRHLGKSIPDLITIYPYMETLALCKGAQGLTSLP